MRVIVATALLLSACGGGSPTTSVNQHEAAEAESPSGLTMAKYQQIQNGMTYAQVVSILGAEGAELSSTELAGTRTVMYSWEGVGGANMNAMFQNDKLIQKAQFGLQ